MQRDKAWTITIGVRRGLGVGLIAAIGIGAIIVFCGRYVAIPWSLSGPGGYRLWMRGLLIGCAGFGFAWTVATACERVGGMTSVVFDSFAVFSAAVLGIALTWVALSQARLLAGETASVFEAALVVVIPAVVGAVIAG